MMSGTDNKGVITEKSPDCTTRRVCRKRFGRNQTYPYLRFSVIYRDGKRREWGKRPRGGEPAVLVQSAPVTCTKLYVTCGPDKENQRGEIIGFHEYVGFEQFRAMRESGKYPPNAYVGSGNAPVVIVEAIVYEEF